MRRILGTTLGTSSLVAWALSCNALLGNQDAILERDATTTDAKLDTGSVGRDGTARDGAMSDASPDASHDVEAVDAQDARPCDACEPVRISDSTDPPWFITADDAGHVYWTTATSVLSCPVNGCDAGVVLATPEGGVAMAPILFYTGDIGFFGPGVLLWGPGVGSGSALDVSNVAGGGYGGIGTGLSGMSPRYEAIEGTYYVWCYATSLYACSFAGKCFPSLASGKACGSLATDSANVYWTDPVARTVRSCILPDCSLGTRTLLTDPSLAPSSVVVADASVYFGAQSDGIYALPVGADGGFPPKPFAHDTSVLWLATDGTYLYWSGSGIHYCPLAGCPADGGLTLAYPEDGGTADYGIAIDAKNVYWTLQRGSAGGSIMKIAKP